MKNQQNLITTSFAPFNLKALTAVRIGRVVLDTNKNNEIMAYHIVPTLIKELVADPLYSRFSLNGYSIREVFNIIAKHYKAGNTQHAKTLYVRAANAIREYNDMLIKQATLDIKIQRDNYFERKELNDIQASHRVRWSQLSDAINKDPDAFKQRLTELSDEQREVWLVRASDYGLTPAVTTMRRKDVYTMRVAPIAAEADDIHPFNIYHDADENDPIVTFVGNHTQTVTLSQDEDEIIAMAMWFAQFGDEFMLKTHTPDGEEITVREARLSNVITEDDFTEYRDFQYDAGDIWD